MKITALTVKNFIGAHNIDVTLHNPVTLFCGANYAGKSSLQEAVRMALTGESVRVGLKKEYKRLVSDGAEVGYAVVDYDGQRAAITLPNGAHELTAGSIPDALPYVLDAQRFAILDGAERRSFIFGLTKLRMSGANVLPRLLQRGCNEEKSNLILPFMRAGFDAAMIEAANRAREAKTEWRIATGETYGDKKAREWKASAPKLDLALLSTAQTEMQKCDTDLEAAQQTVGALEASNATALSAQVKRTAFAEKAGCYARVQEKLLHDQEEMKKWEAKVNATREKAQGASVPTITHPCPCCGVLLAHRMSDSALVEYVKPDHIADPEAVDALPKYERALSLLQSAVTNGQRDLVTAESAAQALKQIEEDSEPPASEAKIVGAKAQVDTLKARRKEVSAEIVAIQAKQAQATAAASKTKTATDSHTRAQDWVRISAALAPDGILGDLLGEALAPICERLAVSSEISDWPLVVIHSDMLITCGGRDYALLSESEKFRANAMIAEAVSHISSVKIMMLDGIDVLDLKGRNDLLYWMGCLVDAGEIDSALLFATLKSLPDKLPVGVGSVWIENGWAGRIKEAA